MDEKMFCGRKITWFSIVDILTRRWYIPVIVILISLIISGTYAFLNVFPMYSCTAKLYIINKEESSISSSDLAVSTSLAKDFEIIINDDTVINEVAKTLEYKYSVSQIKNSISVKNPQNTRIIELTVVTPEKEPAKKIAASICDIAQERLIDIMGVDRISVINKGVLSIEPAGQKQAIIILNGAIIGLIISAIIFLLIAVSDNKITETKQIEEILQLKVLATIPYNKRNKSKQKKD